MFRLSCLFSFSLGLALCFVFAAPVHAALPPNAKVRFYHYDHLGGVDKMTDMDGNVVCSNDYLPYGDIRRGDCTENDEDYGFTGKEKDTETGLIYYGARYYDPKIGRFVSMDPWEGDLLDPQTFNKYSYALNNPIRFIDPTGLYIMESGEVEKGDTLSGITDQLNTHYGTDYNYNDIAKINNISDPDKIQTGAIIRIGTPDGWQPPLNNSGFDEAQWNNLTPEKQKIMNIHKNFYQSGLPDSNGQLNTDEWYRVPGDAATHNIGTSGNADYRGKGARTGQQAIYDKNGDLVTSPENMGTFDLVSPYKDPLGHLRVDVRPWLESGNSPADTTTKEQRIEALGQSTKGYAGLLYLRSIGMLE